MLLLLLKDIKWKEKVRLYYSNWIGVLLSDNYYYGVWTNHETESNIRAFKQIHNTI